MKYFSNLHKLQFIDLIVDGLARPRMFQLMVYCWFDVFRVHICLDSSVENCFLWCLNEDLWLLKRALKVVSVRSTYVPFFITAMYRYLIYYSLS